MPARRVYPILCTIWCRGTVICRGKIKGTIRASKRIEIHTNSEVVGNISAPALLVENGAIFDGTCDMTGSEGKIIKLVQNEEAESATFGVVVIQHNGLAVAGGLTQANVPGDDGS